MSNKTYSYAKSQLSNILSSILVLLFFSSPLTPEADLVLQFRLLSTRVRIWTQRLRLRASQEECSYNEGLCVWRLRNCLGAPHGQTIVNGLFETEPNRFTQRLLAFGGCFTCHSHPVPLFFPDGERKADNEGTRFQTPKKCRES